MTIGPDRSYANRSAMRMLRAALERRAPGVIVHLSMNEKGGGTTVVVHLIHVPVAQRGYGLGQRALDLICDTADQNDWELTLTAVSDFGSELTRLTNWYMRAGFIPTAAAHVLRRQPIRA